MIFPKKYFKNTTIIQHTELYNSGILIHPSTNPKQKQHFNFTLLFYIRFNTLYLLSYPLQLIIALEL